MSGEQKNGLMRWFWRVGIAVGVLTLYSFLTSQVFVTRADFDTEKKTQTIRQEEILRRLDRIERKIDKSD